MNIYEKLNKIQTELSAPKNQRNNFGNYNYRSCEDITEAVKPLLKETKTTLTLSDEINMIGNRFYVVATATLYDTENGECMSVSASAREEENKKGMDASQVTGSTSSYARKYALNGLFAIDDAKDADTEAYGAKPAETKTETRKDEHKFECELCHQTWEPYTNKEGKYIGLREHEEWSKARYNKRVYCPNCCKKLNENKNEDAKHDAE